MHPSRQSVSRATGSAAEVCRVKRAADASPLLTAEIELCYA